MKNPDHKTGKRGRIYITDSGRLLVLDSTVPGTGSLSIELATNSSGALFPASESSSSFKCLSKKN